jgi:ABC-2 type transport system permease protein
MSILLHYWKLNFLSLMEYKVSFLVAIVSMILNDILFISIWYMFFLKFWNIWWIEFWTFAVLLSIFVLVFAIIHIFFCGYQNIWLLIEQWKLDSQLLLPKNMLLRVLASKMDASAFWDLIYAFMLMIFIPNLTILLVLKMVFLAIFWAMTFLWFFLIFNSITFYIWSSRNLTRGIFDAIMWPTHYPPWVFEWSFLKVIFLTILPVYFIIFLPFELSLNFTLEWFLILFFWSLSWLVLWVFIFYKWLQRYESGNMMYTNV